MSIHVLQTSKVAAEYVRSGDIIFGIDKTQLPRPLKASWVLQCSTCKEPTQHTHIHFEDDSTETVPFGVAVYVVPPHIAERELPHAKVKSPTADLTPKPAVDESVLADFDTKEPSQTTHEGHGMFTQSKRQREGFGLTTGYLGN